MSFDNFTKNESLMHNIPCASLQDGSCVAGAGSTEVELSRLIEQYGSQCPGLEQYAIKKFADALKVFPKVSLICAL